MSLSITALFAAAVDADPTAIVDVGGHGRLMIVDLDRRSRDEAGALLASGGRPGSPVRVAPCPGPERSVGLIAAWRAGLVVTAVSVAPTVEDAGAGTLAERDDLLRVAESEVWSETTAAITADGRTLTHADLVGRLDVGVGPVGVIEALLRYR